MKGDTFKQALFVSILAQLSTLPFIINLNNEINLMSIVFNVLFVLMMGYVFLPLTFLTFIFKMFNNLFAEVILIFENILDATNQFSIIIRVGNIHALVAMIYYLFLYIFLVSLEKKRGYGFFYLLLLIILFLKQLNPFGAIYFIDVAQGDSTLIKAPFNSCNVLFDTGGKLMSDITTNNVLPVLKSQGIYELDYLVLTHSHYDHIGGAKTIIDNFKVNNLVVSEYNSGVLLNESIKYAKGKGANIIYVSKGDVFGCNNEYTVLDPGDDHESINNQSIVVRASIFRKTWLLMGDSELKEFETGNVDIIKLGHHGSITSITEELLNQLEPDIAIISVGDNGYGLPSGKVIEMVNSNGTELFRTDNDNTIIYLDIGEGIFLNTKAYNNNILGKLRIL